MWSFPRTPLVEAARGGNAERPRKHIWSTAIEDDGGYQTLNSREKIITAIENARKRAIRDSIEAGTMDDADLDGQGDAVGFKRAMMLGEDTVNEALTLWYARQSFIGHQLAGIIAQHWLVDKACKMPARDAIRNGFNIISADGDEIDPEAIKLIKRWDRKFKLRQNVEQFIHMGRVFGVRIALFKVNSTDPEYYVKPFNPDGITPGSYKGIVQVDPYWCTPILDNNASSQPDTAHFYEPTWWQINGKRYHRSHLVIFRNGELADILKPMYIYGGVPVPQRIMERVYAAERTANEAPQLAMTKRSTVFYTDVAKALGNFTVFCQRLTQWRSLLDNYGVKVADKTDDEVAQFDISLADLDTVIMTQFQIVAAQSNVPATKLMGTQPKGFNSSGDYESDAYHEELETIQVNDMLPLIERHHLLVNRSIVRPKLKMDIGETTVDFNPVDSPSAQDWADINLKKAQSYASLKETGAVDQFDIRDVLRKDQTSGFGEIPEAERPDGEGVVQDGDFNGQDDSDPVPPQFAGQPAQIATPQTASMPVPSAPNQVAQQGRPTGNLPTR